MTTFEIVFIPIIFLKEFVKRTLVGIFKQFVKFENWNFNRKLPK